MLEVEKAWQGWGSRHYIHEHSNYAFHVGSTGPISNSTCAPWAFAAFSRAIHSNHIILKSLSMKLEGSDVRSETLRRAREKFV